MYVYNECNLVIELEFSHVNDKFLNTEVSIASNMSTYNKNVTPEHPGNTTISINTRVNMPCTIKITTNGKNNKDTIIDNNNTVVNDLYVKIKTITLDYLPLGEHFVWSNTNIVTDAGDALNSNYIGFNGVAILELTEMDVVDQCIIANK